MCLLATCTISYDVGHGILPQVLCSEKQGVLQPKIMKILYYKIKKNSLRYKPSGSCTAILIFFLCHTNAKQYLVLRQNEAFPERIHFGNNCHKNQVTLARVC